MLEFGMNKILKFLTIITLFLLYKASLIAGFLPDKLYKSIEKAVKVNTGMEKPDYDEYASEEEIKEIETAEEREEFIKSQFVKKEDIVGVYNIEKEKIRVETEATEFFDSLNEENKKPVNME